MNRRYRQIAFLLALLGVAAILVPAAQASGNLGDAGLARGVLETQFGFSPSRAVDWTTGVCSYPDNPSTCYLTPQQAIAQSIASAEAMGARPLPSTPPARKSSVVGDVGFARGVLETQFGFSPSRAVDWTTGVCSYADNPSTCYLTARQAAAQSKAEARSMGVPPLSAPTPSPSVTSDGFQWGDAGIGAGATVGLLLILGGVGTMLARGRRQHPANA